jgi:hypothetical protein
MFSDLNRVNCDAKEVAYLRGEMAFKTRKKIPF